MKIHPVRNIKKEELGLKLFCYIDWLGPDRDVEEPAYNLLPKAFVSTQLCCCSGFAFSSGKTERKIWFKEKMELAEKDWLIFFLYVKKKWKMSPVILSSKSNFHS